MELAGLEPATSWVRYRVRTPDRGDLSSLGCSEFGSVRSVWYPTWYLGVREEPTARRRAAPCSRRFRRCNSARLVSARLLRQAIAAGLDGKADDEEAERQRRVRR